MPHFDDYLAYRLRSLEMRAIDDAARLLHEPRSAFARRAALEAARKVLESAAEPESDNVGAR